MDVNTGKRLCRALVGTTERDTGPPTNVLSLKVGGKTFAYFNTSEPEQWRFSIRVSADRFVELTDRPDVQPAKYMGRFRWITIVDVAEFHEDYLHELILASYETALTSLSMKRQREITA